MEKRSPSSPDLCEQRANLKSCFQNYYQGLGYKVQEPVAIYPSVDKSTIFIGSTISVLKKSLDTSLNLKQGICLVQPCLRTQPRNDLVNMAYISDYNSFFHQAGVLIAAGNYETVCHSAFNFLTNSLNIRPEFIKVQTSSQLPEISNYWERELPDNVLRNGHPQNYYKWGYGENGLTGIGITFSVRSKLISEYRDIGNVIIMSKGGSEIAIEWGFGIETLLSRVHGLPKPQSTSRICDLTSFEPGLKEKFLDALVVSIEMYKSGIHPGRRGGEKQILRDHLKLVHFLSRKLNIDRGMIKNLIDQYSLNTANLGISGKILEFMRVRDHKLQKYSESAPKVIGSCGASGANTEDELRRLGDHLGLWEIERVDIKI